jgi:hypothetical protein
MRNVIPFPALPCTPAKTWLDTPDNKRLYSSQNALLQRA